MGGSFFRETLMSEATKENKGQEPAIERFSLADLSVLNELFEVVLYDVVRRSKMVAAGELKKEEAVAMDKQSAAFLSAVLAGTLGADALEQSCHRRGTDVLARDVEAQRIDSAIEDVESLGIGFSGVFDADVLTHEP